MRTDILVSSSWHKAWVINAHFTAYVLELPNLKARN